MSVKAPRSASSIKARAAGDGRKEKSTHTQSRLRAAGWRLFGTLGYENTSVAQLCAEAGVTTGALYHHYGDKQGLFAAVAEDLDRALVARSEEAAAARGGTVLEGFFASVDAFLNSGTDPQGRRIGLVDAPAVLGADRWLEIRDRHGLKAMTAAVRRLQAVGLISVGEPRRLARIILSVLMGAVEALPPSPKAAQAALPETRRLVRQVLRGLIDPPRP